MTKKPRKPSKIFVQYDDDDTMINIVDLNVTDYAMFIALTSTLAGNYLEKLTCLKKDCMSND